MNKIAIYTAIIGSYDNIQQPNYIDERYDYFIFSDCIKQSNIGVWQVLPVEYINQDKTRIARFVKTHPETLLPQYDATIWIDANISILTSILYDRGLELLENSIPIASIKHPLRDCIYDEAFLVLANCLEKEEIINDWCHQLRLKNYPRHIGLFESNVLFRRNNQQIYDVDCQWWHIIESYSRRDQLSLNYILYAQNLPLQYIFAINEHCRNSNNISVQSHDSNANTRGRRSIMIGKFEYVRNRCRARYINGEDYTKDFHYWMWGQNKVLQYICTRMWGVFAIFSITAKTLLSRK